MNIQEIRQVQANNTVVCVSAIWQASRRRFLNAATLLELEGPLISSLRDQGNRTVDLMPLMAMYETLCERYLTTIYSPQESLFPDPDDAQDTQWGSYFYQMLLPHLIGQDEVVRNVLRAMRAIPSSHPEDSSQALVHYVDEMTLPKTPPPWAPENVVD